MTIAAQSGQVTWSSQAIANEPHTDVNFSNNHGFATLTVGSAANYERFLLPLRFTSSLRGAFGTVWETVVYAFSDTPAGVQLFPFDHPCPVPTCVPESQLAYRFPSRRMMMLFTVPAHPAIPGSLLYTRKDNADRLHLSITVRDISRGAASAGTEIPVIRESMLRSGPLQLFPVRIDARFRHTLRIYDIDANENADVTVRLFDMLNGRPLGEFTRRFTVDRLAGGSPFAELPAFPGYIEVGGLGADLMTGTVRVEIEPATPAQRLWAFVSTTNNETQQVTIVTLR
jgi:hypothetical protein